MNLEYLEINGYRKYLDFMKWRGKMCGAYRVTRKLGVS